MGGRSARRHAEAAVARLAVGGSRSAAAMAQQVVIGYLTELRWHYFLVQAAARQVKHRRDARAAQLWRGGVSADHALVVVSRAAARSRVPPRAARQSGVPRHPAPSRSSPERATERDTWLSHGADTFEVRRRHRLAATMVHSHQQHDLAFSASRSLRSMTTADALKWGIRALSGHA